MNKRDALDMALDFMNNLAPKARLGLVDFLEQYKLFYGIIEKDNHKLELEAPYISDEESAVEFRNFMFQYYKNQHTILKCALTVQQGFELEAGDILKINSSRKVYGSLLQDSKTIIDQEAYPLFYITSISKSLDKVDIECVQLHNLSLDGIEDHVEEIESDDGLSSYGGKPSKKGIQENQWLN